MKRLSVAMAGPVETALVRHLLREDGDEDLCFFAWRPSTGRHRLTALVSDIVLPREGDRAVHGNAEFQPSYALRAVQEVADSGCGLGFVHSHPGGRGWQRLNATDQEAERRIANLAQELTGLPLLGMTLAGDQSWSARIWWGSGRAVAPEECESVRVIADGMKVTFNDRLLPRPEKLPTQLRTVHAWGPETQAIMARLRIAVAGVGSVGMSVAEILARTGVRHIGVFDFDSVEWVNLDRLRGARATDAYLRRAKVHVARRLLGEASTAASPAHEFGECSICEAEGLSRLLDYDIIFSCVDRPWPRHVLNTIAFADLIPVVEGGLSVFQNPNGSLRNAYWSSTIVRPGRRCLVCLGQYDPGLVQLERDGSLDDPSYIANLPPDSPLRRRENVSAMSMSVTARFVEQFISYVAQPSGEGDYGPLRFNLRGPEVQAVEGSCEPGCDFPGSVGIGDLRLDPTGSHPAAERVRSAREKPGVGVRSLRSLDRLLNSAGASLERFARGRGIREG